MPVVAAARAEGGASYRKSSGGTSLHRGRPATRGRGSCSCRRPQVRAPLSPRYIRGERFALGIGPPPTPIPQTCSGVAQEGSDAPPAPPTPSRGPPPRRARLSGGHPGSWPDHTPALEYF
ncbi:hypothetical protein NDU88_001003 [Pleurodeles waltl]|uniref:Uncharacterized protein n=1 Tax=Pleurodeles waltl TaxID=8319 RepID=A0AAV7SYY4_PLEWA|nr:hypothetical protein NDU88_001003 [Pleurodeles waltl]